MTDRGPIYDLLSALRPRRPFRAWAVHRKPMKLVGSGGRLVPFESVVFANVLYFEHRPGRLPQRLLEAAEEVLSEDSPPACSMCGATMLVRVDRRLVPIDGEFRREGIVLTCPTRDCGSPDVGPKLLVTRVEPLPRPVQRRLRPFG